MKDAVGLRSSPNGDSYEAMKTYTEKRFFEWHEDDVSVTLRAKSGSYGGGQRGLRYIVYQDTVGPLCWDDWKGPNSQYVEADKLIIMEEENEEP